MKKIFQIFLCTISLFLILPLRVNADVGPKPSVRIRFQNVTRTCYVTLLSEQETTGPFSSITEPYSSNDAQETEAYRIFTEYAETDDYYFLGNVEKIDPEHPEYSWTYYPPKMFKVAVYDPADGSLKVSDPAERTAFDTFYTADLNEDGIVLDEDVHLKREIIGLLSRMILTVAVELVLALIFGYRKKKEIGTIVKTNLFTQLLLNLVMAFMDYYMGMMVWIFLFPVMELVVLVIEMIVYLRKFRDHSRWKTILYSILANLATLFMGIYIEVWLSVL